jgi:hypothetical protein
LRYVDYMPTKTERLVSKVDDAVEAGIGSFRKAGQWAGSGLKGCAIVTGMVAVRGLGPE